MTSPIPRDEEESFDPAEAPEVLDEDSLDEFGEEFDEEDFDDLDGDSGPVGDDVEEVGEVAGDDAGTTAVAADTDTASNEIASGFVDPDGDGFTDETHDDAVNADDDERSGQMPFDDGPELVAVASGDDEVEGLREGEFVCRGCHIARRETQLADEARQLCRDCA